MLWSILYFIKVKGTPVPFFILFNFLELKTIEEPELENRLGKDYSKYKKRVPMFFPKLKKK